MRTFTQLLICFLPLFSSPILAKSILPAFSEPSDTLFLADNPDEEDLEYPAPSANPDSLATKPGVVLAPTFVAGCDVCGTGTGFIDLTPDPNTPGPWLYMWSNGEVTQDIFGLTPGVYVVTVFDGNQNFQVAQIIVGACPFIGPISVTGAVTGSTLCNGNSNGAINLTVDPTPNLWNYFWSNGETTEDISNLDPGTYTVSVTWGVTCTTEETFIVPNLTNAPNLSPPLGGFGLDFCETGNGTAAVFASGGTPPYTYEWSNGATDLQIANLVTGEYTVTVTGANGCSSILMGMVPPGTLPVEVDLNVLTYNTTCIGANGSISITVTPPGVWLPTATYLWSNGATTQNISNLPTGSYRVTVTRLGVCTATEVWFIEDEPILPQLSFSITAASCGNSNGNINLTTLPGGLAPYVYAWSNGATTEDLSNILAGMYEVTITSANGCTSTGSATVEDTPVVFGYSALVTDQTSCDTINGRISLSLFPANLAYTWSTGDSTTNLFPIAPGDYTVTISAGGTCTSVETITVADVRAYPSIPGLIDTTTCGLANGGVNLFVFGNPVAPLTFQWSTGDTSQNLMGVLADTFFVTVTSATGCSNTNTFIVPNFNDTIRIQANLADNISCTTPTGYIALDVTPLDTLYTYLWSNGMTTDSLFNLAGGDYLVTVTLGVSCIALDTFAIVSTALPPNLASSGTPTNCDFSNGAVDLSVGGGAGPFTYLWSNAATTEDLANLPPGTYTVTVTGVNSCTAVSAATVLNNNVPLSIGGAPVENTSCAAPNGALDINISPAGVYNYLWSNAATTEDLNNLAPGTYTVTVSLGTCLSSSTFSVADNALSPNLAASGSPSSCDFSNGSADLSVSGGAGPYTFFWSNTATTEDLANVAAGNYSVTVTGANSCTAVSTATVLNNNISLNLSAAPQGNSSCTTPDGNLDLNVVPAGVYTYFWSNAATTEDLVGLNAGSYTVTVSLGSCQSSSTFAVADNTATPVLGSNITASICSVNNGGIDLSVSGPAGPFGFLWSNTATTEDIASLLPGNYSVTVTAANGCTSVATLNVPNNASTFSLAAAPAPQTDCASNNGAIDLNITPAGVYTYLWSNTATTEDLSGLPPGTYTVSVTESGSCTATASYFVIDQRTNPSTSQSIVPEVCGLANGSIDLGVIGGTAPYGFQWTGGPLSEDLTNITAGTYTVTVTDANNCTATTSAIVPGNSISFSLAGTPSSNSSCILNNGAIDLSVNPAGGVSYLWSNMAMTEDLSGLPAGTYTVTVSAGGNCTNTAVFTISSNVPSPLLSQNISAATCGQASGSIDLSVTGSPAPYQYFWSNAATTEDLANILSGSFTVTVTAANGCTTVDNIMVPENSFSPAIGSVLTPTSSCTANNGAIDLTINPVAPGYTFIWSNGAMTEDQSNIAAGTYTVTVSAGGACSSTAALTVGSNIPLPALSQNIAAATCGQASGGVDLSVTGAPGPYQYFWSNAATTEDLVNILSGSFTVTVTASNGCTSVGNFTVPENVIAPVINGTPTADNSCLVNNGAVDLTVGPATGYLFTWSNAATTEDLTNIAAGTYTVTVNGGGACTGTANFVVTSNTPAPALSNNIAAATCGQANGNIDISVAGSPTPYVYIWSNAATTEDLNAILSGNYTVTVTAANGCTTTGNFTVPENGINPVISGTPTADNSCVANNGAIDLTVGSGTYTFTWSNAATTEDLASVAPGSYTVTVNGGGTCTASATFVVADQTTQPQATITAATTALDCSTTSTTLNGNVTGTPNPSSFQWSINGNPVGSGNSSLAVNLPGVYNLVVTDNVTSCTATANITVTQNLNPPALSVATPGALTCTSLSQTLTGSSTVSGVQFAWATIVGTDTTILGAGATYSVSTAGTYYLIGINPANNCANATSVNVTANQTLPTANAGTPFTLDCAGETAPLNGSGSGAPSLAYQWTTQDGHFVSGANSPAPLIDEAGTYVLSVTNPANGCTDTDEVTILPEVPVAYASVLQPTCQEVQGTVLLDSVTGLSDPILYSLNNGPSGTQTQFDNLVPGDYTILALGGNGCSATTTVTVNAPTLVVITLTPEAEIDLGYSYLIDATVNIPSNEIASVIWTPSTGLECDTCLSTTATPFSTTQYQVLVVSDAGCEARGNLTLTVDKTRKIFGPNIFSPNDDGRNDVFTIFADPFTVVKIKSLQVYSRWGEQVFERLDFAAGDTQIGWDGTFQGEKLNPAVFVWQAVVVFVDGKEEFFTGDVTLQR